MLRALADQPEAVVRVLAAIGEILRNYAIERIQDPRVLKIVVLSNFSTMGRRVAVRRLETPDVLLEVAEGDPEMEVRKAAFDKLEEIGQPAAPDIMLKRPLGQARKPLMDVTRKRRRDSDSYSYSATELDESTYDGRTLAHTGGVWIAEEAKVGSEPHTGEPGTGVIRKQLTLEEAAAREAAAAAAQQEAAPAEEHEEPAPSEKVALDPKTAARKNAVERMANPESLAKFALDDPHPEVRLAALRRLEDRAVLKVIAERDSDENVQGFALARLRALGVDPEELRRRARERAEKSRQSGKPDESGEFDEPPDLHPKPAGAPSAALGLVDRILNKVLGRLLKRGQTKTGGEYNPTTSMFGRVTAKLFGKLNIRLPGLPGPRQDAGPDTTLEDLARLRTTFKRFLLAIATTLGCLIVASLGYIQWRENQGETYFLEGQKLFQKGDPRAVLWFARAVSEKPSSWEYRGAAARSLLGNPGLVFLEHIPGKWDAVSVASDGSVLAVTPEGQVQYIRGRQGAEVKARFARWDPSGPGIVYIGTDNSVYFEEAGEMRVASGPNEPLQRAWRSPEGKVVLAATERALFRRGASALEVFVRTSGPVVDVTPGQDRAVTLEGGHARVWDLVESKSAGVLPAEAGRTVTQAALAPDGRRAICVDTSRQATLWGASAGWASVNLAHPADFGVFTPDGSRLVTADKNQLRTWEPAGGRALREFSNPEAVTALSIDPEGRYLALLGPSGISFGPATVLTPPRTPVPDWDQPPDLLVLEARLLGRGWFTSEGVESLTHDQLAAQRLRWEKEAAEHAAECQAPDSNLWKFYREAGSSK